jgi:hypothetical protein
MYKFRSILRINGAVTSLNSINQLIVVMGTCFLWGKNWIFKYHLDEIRASSGYLIYADLIVRHKYQVADDKRAKCVTALEFGAGETARRIHSTARNTMGSP